MPEVFSSRVVTRAMAREQNKEDREYSLEDTFMCRLDDESKGSDDVVVGQMPVMSHRRLVELQSEDPDLVNLSKSIMHEEEDSDEPSAGEWSSPCVLVPKTDDTFRFCTDDRMLNSKTKSDSFPVPRIDYCIDHISGAKYVKNSKCSDVCHTERFSSNADIIHVQNVQHLRFATNRSCKWLLSK